MDIIRTNKVSYDYDNSDEQEQKDAHVISQDKRAVDDVSIDIKEGEFVSILGHNGSGKSTLAKNLNGLLLPSEGTILISGMDTADEGSLWEIRKTVGMVFQNPDNQIISNVVEEDVGFGPENIGIPSGDIWKRVDKALDAVGMNAYRMKSPNKLSGGQKQRVAIAGVMAMKPQCIVLDEPTAMLDPSGRKEVIATISELNKKENITIVLITHFMEEAILADRIYVMDDGRVVMHGKPRDIFSHVDKIYSYGLDVPQVTELAYQLRCNGVDISDKILTVDDFVDAILPLIKNKKTDDIKDTKEPSSQHIIHDDIPLISLSHVSYTYGLNTAFEESVLKDINLDIYKGEFVGLIGHTGSGKSTLIQHMNGLIKPDSGNIYYDGKNIYEEGYDIRSLRMKVGLVFQYPEHQLFEIDVLTDVCFGPKNEGLSEEDAKERAKWALSMVGIDESFYNISPFDLSGGQQRRVAIAGVLAMKPDVLILDEPTAGLDPHGRDTILSSIKSLQKNEDMTVILVSHSMEDIARYADRVLVIDKGMIVYDDDTREVFMHTDRLEEIGLAAPQITYAMKKLHDKGIPVDADIITVDKAKEKLLKLIR